MIILARPTRTGDDAPRRALGWLFVFVVAWTVVEAIAAPLLGKLSPYQVVWMRYGIHLVVVALVWGRRDPASLMRTGRPVLQMFRSGLMLAMPASWAIAVAGGMDARAVMAVFWIAPLLIVGFAVMLRQERVHAARWSTAGVAVGAAWLASGAAHLPVPAEWPLPLAMAGTFALYVVLTRSLATEPTPVNLFYTGAGVFVLLTPAMPAVWSAVSAPDVLRMVAVGTIGVVALYALDRMAGAAPVGRTAPAHAIQPALLVLGGAAGTAGRWEVAGATTIVALVAALWVAGAVRSRTAEPTPDRGIAAASRRHGASR